MIEKIYGIDLGTTYSAIAYIDETGCPSVISNMQGFQTTPSVVYFETETNVVVGDPAKLSAPSDPDRVVSFVKREIGDDSYRFTTDGKDYDAITISSFILKKLAKDASEALAKEVKDVVITCPAYFGTDEKEATKSAAELAGLNVLDLLNEPAAAALGYGLKLKEGTNKTILVYDLGGGTFDITIIKVSDKNIEVVATGGDSTLGGKDWDRAIMDHIVSVWQEETGETDDILADDPKYLSIQLELALLAEKIKMILTSKEKHPVKFAPEGYDVLRRYEFTREKFDEITEPLLARTIDLTKEILQIAAEKEGISEFKYDEFILVGGSTYMPQVPARIKQDLGVSPVPFEPDLAVAKGAAIWSKFILEDKNPPIDWKEYWYRFWQRSANEYWSEYYKNLNKELIESLAKPLVLAKNYRISTIYKGSQCVWDLLIKNRSLPISITKIFRTQFDCQKTVEIVLVENDYTIYKNQNLKEDEIDDTYFSKELCKATLVLSNNLPKGSPIEVNINVNTEGLLHLTVADPSTGKFCDIEVWSAFDNIEQSLHPTAVDPSTGRSCEIKRGPAFEYEYTEEEIRAKLIEELSGLEID